MKDVERILLLSLALSSLALVLAVICFPLLHFNLSSLTEMVHKDMDEFKGSSDTLWKDLMEIESTVTARERREDYVYKYKPSKSKSSLPRANTHRVHAAPTVEIKAKPGKKVFTDSEYIGAVLSPMESKETPQKCEMKLVPNPKCSPGTPGPAGMNGEDGVDGLPGSDGLNGETPSEYYQEQNCIQCPEGEPGIKGPPGRSGDPGEQGPRGIPGMLKELPGPKGPVGEVGVKGEQGVPGPRGQMGVSVKKWICPPGDKGSTGPKGPRGGPGPQGESGEMGIQGVSGRRGPIGKAGLMGEVGGPGPAGVAGRLGFEEHYCQCPERSKGVRGKFTLPQVPNYVTPEEEEYPKNVFADRFLQ